MTYTICESCIDIKDKACVDECPVDCIYEGPRMLYIHPDECVDYIRRYCDFLSEAEKDRVLGGNLRDLLALSAPPR